MVPASSSHKTLNIISYDLALYTIARDLSFFDSGQSHDHACQIETVSTENIRSTREEQEEIVQVALFSAFLPGIYLCLQRCNEYLPER